MKKQGWGRIINMSSTGVKFGGGPGTLPCTISKSGLETVTTAFAKAGAPHDIFVNAIRAGVTDIKFHDLNPGKNMRDDSAQTDGDYTRNYQYSIFLNIREKFLYHRFNYCCCRW